MVYLWTNERTAALHQLSETLCEIACISLTVRRSAWQGWHIRDVSQVRRKIKKIFTSLKSVHRAFHTRCTALRSLYARHSAKGDWLCYELLAESLRPRIWSWCITQTQEANAKIAEFLSFLKMYLVSSVYKTFIIRWRVLRSTNPVLLSVSGNKTQIQQVAQLWQKDGASSAILSGWVNLRLNFRLKTYVSRQYPWTIR